MAVSGRGHQKYPSCFFFSIEPTWSLSISRPSRSEVRRGLHLHDDRGQVAGVGADGAGQRVAAEGAEADHFLARRLARLEQRIAVVVDHDQRAEPLDHRTRAGRSRAARSRCLRSRCRSRCRARSSCESGKTRMLSPGARRVLKMRQSSGRWFLGSQACWALRCEKMRSLARDFSSSRRAPPIAASYSPAFERLAQRLRLHDVGVARRAVVERVDAVRQALGIGVDEQLEPVLLRHPVAEGDHLAELPRGVDVEQRERDAARDRTPCAPDAAGPRSPCRSNTSSPAARSSPRPRGRSRCFRIRGP